MRATFITIILLAGCDFDARGLGSETGSESTGDRCCENYPDAGQRASEGPGPEPDGDPEPGTSTGGSTGEGSEPEAVTTTNWSSSTTSDASTTTTGDEDGSSSSDTSSSTSGSPHGEPCVDDAECAPDEDAPDTVPMCLGGACEMSCSAPQQCPEGMMCLWFVDGKHHVCTIPI